MPRPAEPADSRPLPHDIDTHGFAILDPLRANFPQAQSFLMDRDTLPAHVERALAAVPAPSRGGSAAAGGQGAAPSAPLAPP